MKNAQVEIIQLDQLLVEPSVETLEQVAHQLVVVTHGQDQIQGELVVTHGPVETLEQVEQACLVVVVVVLGPVETPEQVEQACLVVVVVVLGQVEIQEQAEDQLLDSLP